MGIVKTFRKSDERTTSKRPTASCQKTSIVGDCGENGLEILAQICCNDSKQIFDFDPNLAVYEM